MIIPDYLIFIDQYFELYHSNCEQLLTAFTDI